MAILFGTQSNGETLPVLVDQFGNLLAKGIEGAEGPPGPEGPPGKDGGSFALPPDPYEGAFLGWLNNELAWIGTPPVPVPSGLFGPITSWDSAGTLTVEGEIPSQVAQGVFVYQCNEDGSIYVEGWNNSQIWSAYGTATNGYSDYNRTWASAFDGIAQVGPNSLNPASNSTATCTFPTTPTFSTLRIFCGYGGSAIQNGFVINGVDVTSQISGQQWYTITGVSSPLTSVTLTKPAGGFDPLLHAIELDGTILVDSGQYPTAPNLNLLVQSVSNQNLIGTANRTNNFTIGKYLRVPEQNVARWLYDGNLSKVITSTGFDISRLTGN